MFKKAFLACVLCASYCFAGSMHEDIEDNKYVNFGKKFDCVVQIAIYNDPEKLAFFGSGVVIHPEWVITSAHGLTQAKKITFKLNDKIYESLKIICHPEFNLDHGKYDLALIKIPKIQNFGQFPILNTDPDLLNRNVTISGFGMSCYANSTQKITYDGNRRAGSNFSTALENHLIICEMDKDNPSELEFLINSGDSGGGLFVNGELAGVNSCIIATDGEADGSYGDQSGHTRIDIFAEWIQETIVK